MGNCLLPESPGARKRLWWAYHVTFALLAFHFALVYLAPSYILDYRLQQRSRSFVRANTPQSKVLTDANGTPRLWAGDDPKQHFDISQFQLNADQLHYGLGREAFPALIKPTFYSVAQANKDLDPQVRVLTVKVADEVKVYPVDLLMRHEVVNDTVGGRPVFASYCILADLGAVYDRQMGDHTLTFGVSGYTYADPEVWEGLDAFVLWDRDTQSLWWPPLGKAVSGPLVGTPMKVLDRALWSQTTWGQTRKQYPNAKVLEPGQDMPRPTSWPQLVIEAGASTQAATSQPFDPETAIAPHWGENPDL